MNQKDGKVPAEGPIFDVFLVEGGILRPRPAWDLAIVLPDLVLRLLCKIPRPITARLD